MSRRFVVEVLGGVIAWDCYRHSFNDREANARAIAAGRYAWCEDARVYHRHWIFGDRPQDRPTRGCWATTRSLSACSTSGRRRVPERLRGGDPSLEENRGEIVKDVRNRLKTL
jgi:hypothetical protein